jgi:hypothetical protein
MLDQNAPPDKGMAENLAEFLELLSAARSEVIRSGRMPTEIPADLKAALLRLISE